MPFDNYADLAALHLVRVLTTPFSICFNRIFSFSFFQLLKIIEKGVVKTRTRCSAARSA